MEYVVSHQENIPKIVIEFIKIYFLKKPFKRLLTKMFVRNYI